MSILVLGMYKLVCTMMEYYLYGYWYRFKAIGPFEDDLYSSMLVTSSKFLTEASNKGNRDEDIFLDFKASIWIQDRSC